MLDVVFSILYIVCCVQPVSLLLFRLIFKIDKRGSRPVNHVKLRLRKHAKTTGNGRLL